MSENQTGKRGLTPKSENISEWYNDVVLQAELADYAPVKGCMVIRPYGYAIWETVQKALDGLMKSVGVQNAYFPLFIPESLLKKEKEHVAGFSPELAVVTIAGGEKLKEPLIVRPTSETIMYSMFSKWIQSWRDLPILINQWNNAVRWEKRTYLFLRTTEFLWQEGHTAHESEQEAKHMVFEALDWYKQIYEDYFAIPVIRGRKSEKEKFAGAKETYAIEALMPDGKALQGATSHNLGQNFSKAFEIKFQNKEGQEEYVWQTSWGLSTRSLGGLFLTHGDNNGLILPPRMAPIQVVIVPIARSDKERNGTLGTMFEDDYCNEIEGELKRYGLCVHIDYRDTQSAGRKFNEWELKGVPIRLEIGKKEADKNYVTLVRRDTSEKIAIDRQHLVVEVEKISKQIQQSLFAKAKKFLDDNTREVISYDEFKQIMDASRGFLKAFWCEDPACEAKIKAETKASTRVLPIDAKEENGRCIYCGKDAAYRWYFAQAY